MTPQDLKDFRARMGWSREELARQLEVSSSRLDDYERGETRSNPSRPAPIPKVVELACRWLEEHARPLSPEGKAALWSDDRNWPQYSGPPIDDSREAIYDEPRGQ
jgi:transcriptional regulator with XRE-family HTH domain